MKKKTLVTLVVLLVLGGVVWAILPEPPDPRVVRIQQLQEKLFDPDANLKPEERRKLGEEFGKEMEKFTPDEQIKLMRENPPPIARRMQERVVEFFDLPPEQQTAALDKQIDEFERMRKQWERQSRENGGERRGPPGGGFAGGRGGMNGKDSNEFRKRILNNTTPQQRAMFSEYFDRMNERRRERGLPDFRGPRR